MAPTSSVYQSIPAILATIITTLQTNGSRLTDFNVGSGTRDLSEAVAAVVSVGTQTADQLNLDSYLDTATGSALDALGQNNWMVPRKAAVQATGSITITRQSTSGALTIPAGWSQLATTPAAPGDTGIAVLTTQDANFAAGVATSIVTAQAVLGGQNGNLSAGTFLTPLASINTVSSQNGYQVTTAFTGGVDAESDDAYRARIPIAVQGRSKGRDTSFLAAALSVPGVISAGVLHAGQTRGDGTIVPVNLVEVYYQGSTGLLSQVTSAVGLAATSNQDPHTYASATLTAPRGPQRATLRLTAYCHLTTDPVALKASLILALQGYVNTVGIGQTAHLSQVIDTALGVPGVISVDIPSLIFVLFGGTGAADITVPLDSYANLDAIDANVTVNQIA